MRFHPIDSIESLSEVWALDADAEAPADIDFEASTVFYAEAEECDSMQELRVVDVDTVAEGSVEVTFAAAYPPGTEFDTDEVMNLFVLGSIEGEYEVVGVFRGDIGEFP